MLFFCFPVGDVHITATCPYQRVSCTNYNAAIGVLPPSCEKIHTATSLCQRASCTNYNAAEIHWGLASKLRENWNLVAKLRENTNPWSWAWAGRPKAMTKPLTELHWASNAHRGDRDITGDYSWNRMNLWRVPLASSQQCPAIRFSCVINRTRFTIERPSVLYGIAMCYVVFAVFWQVSLRFK